MPTKNEWIESFNNTEHIETIGVWITDLWSEKENATLEIAQSTGYKTLEDYLKSIDEQIAIYEEEIRELRINVIPTDEVGDYYGEE